MSDFPNLRAARQAKQRKSFASRTVSATSKDNLHPPSDENFHAALPSILELVVTSEKGREIHAKTAFQPGKQPYIGPFNLFIYISKRSKHHIPTPSNMCSLCILHRFVLRYMFRSLHRAFETQKMLKMSNDLVLQRCSPHLALLVLCLNFNKGMSTCGLVTPQIRVFVSPARVLAFFRSSEPIYTSGCRQMFGTDTISKAEEPCR